MSKLPYQHVGWYRRRLPLTEPFALDRPVFLHAPERLVEQLDAVERRVATQHRGNIDEGKSDQCKTMEGKKKKKKDTLRTSNVKWLG